VAAQVVFDFGPLLREKCVASAHPLRRKCYASQMYIGCASVLNTTFSRSNVSFGAKVR